MKLVIQLLLLAAGFLLLIKGADKFVEGASKIADKLHIPQLVIGLTIVAFGTSAPEAAVSITAALHHNAGITIGNVLGSNILNILLILGLTSVILPLAVQNSTLKIEMPYVILVSAVLLILGAIGGEISFIDGIILWILFIVFFVYLISLAKKGQPVVSDVQKAGENESLIKMILLTVLGMAAIILGSDISVKSATNIAEMFHISEAFIGLTIVAFGTSLPELITSVTAGLKGKDDIAVGNIVGSNLFNILFVVGTTALITPVPFASSFLIDGAVCVVSAVLLFFCALKGKKLRRTGGIIMLVSYAGYFIYLLNNIQK